MPDKPLTPEAIYDAYLELKDGVVPSKKDREFLLEQTYEILKDHEVVSDVIPLGDEH